MPSVVSDIILSPARVLVAAVGATLPADTVAAAGAWPAAWTEIGYTEAPLSVEYAYETVDKMVEQSLTAVARMKTAESLRLETTLSELTGINLQYVWEGTLSTTTASAGQPGKEELTLGGEPYMTERAWGFEGYYIDEDSATFPIRFFIYKATAETGGSLEFAKEKPIGIPLKVAALADMTKSKGQRLFKFQKILEPAT